MKMGGVGERRGRKMKESLSLHLGSFTTSTQFTSEDISEDDEGKFVSSLG
jgi:hypothetical protein